MTLLRTVKMYEIHGHIFWAQQQIYTPLIHWIFGHIFWTLKPVCWSPICSDNALVYFPFNLFWFQRLLSFRSRFQLGVAHRSFCYKKTCYVVLWSSKHEITFRHEVIFVFIFRGNIVKKCQKWGFGKKRKKGGEGGGFKSSEDSNAIDYSIYFYLLLHQI